MIKYTIKNLLLMSPVLFLLSCSISKQESGPFFGNGMKNGWADQNSISIWTRLTKNKEANFKGIPFIEIPRKEMLKLAKSPNIDSIYSTQIPAGNNISDMEGYCPGASGLVQLVYHPINDSINLVKTAWHEVDEKMDYTYQWQLKELKAGQTYVTRIYSRGLGKTKISDSLLGKFATPPAWDAESEIKFCIVSCHDYNRRDDRINGHKIYPSMTKLNPDFYVHTGDIEYMDKPTPYALTEELARFKWNRIFSLPFQRTFYNNHTSYFMKDDHDVGFDDSYPSRDYGMIRFERGLEIFDKEQFPTAEKTYKTVRWGKDFQIWIVEGRNYRSKNTIPDGAEKTIWGKEQKDWFYETVNASDATFKLLITSSPILGPDRLKKNDNLSNKNYTYEREEILSFIKKQNNFFIANGDRHWQYVTHFEGTNLWEFGTGAGSDAHAGGWSQNDYRPEHKFLRVKGGFLSGIIKQVDGVPAIQFIHHDVDGKVVNRMSFKVK